jgi:tRNA uridine 5-carboxymethylaminomethyl modification enzyme
VFADQLKGPLLQDCRASDFLKRPEVRYAQLEAVEDLNMPAVTPAVAEQLEIQSKYAGYIERQSADIARLKKHESTRLPENFSYESISGLSAEVVQKLNQVRPISIAQAGRISGVTPAALSLLLVHLKKQRMLA